MAIDLSYDPFVTRVDCDRACADNHDATNLVSLERNKRNAGLQAENFVVPPLEVIFHMKFEIFVSCVRVWPKFHSHSTAAGRRPYSIQVMLVGRMGTRNAIGSMESVTADAFVFHNIQYQPRQSMLAKFGPVSLPKLTAPVVEHRGRYKHGVQQVIVKVWASDYPRPPGIARVEIWGQPACIRDDIPVFGIVDGFAQKRAEEERRRLEGLERQRREDAIRRQQEEEKRQAEFAEAVRSCVPRPAVDTAAAVELPKEIKTMDDLQVVYPAFFDPIVCDLMTYPMLLPSGHTIDNSTLERYCDQETVQGRVANDPFTRIPFEHPSRVPVAHVSLKARMDEVLQRLQETGAFPHVGRAVGDSVSASASTSSFQGGAARVSTLLAVVDEPSVDIEEPPSKRPKLDLQAEAAPSVVSCPVPSAPLSHEDALKASLKASIDAVLAGSGMSRTEEANAAPAIAAVKSVICGRCNSKNPSLYGLPCGHLMCRNCLSDVTVGGNEVFVCAVPFCRTPVRKTYVIKVHTS